MGLLSKKDKSLLPSELNDQLEKNNGKSLRSQTEDDSDFVLPSPKRARSKSNPFPVYFIFWSTLAFSVVFLSYKKVDVILKSGQVTSPKLEFKISKDSLGFYLKKLTGNLPGNLSPNDIEKNLEKLLADNSRNWGISVEVYPTGLETSKYWSYHKDILGERSSSELLYQLKNNPPATSTFLSSSLPQGVMIRQNYLESNQALSLDALLSVPTKDMLIQIKAVNQIDLSKASKTIPELVSLIYWSFTGNN